MSFLEEAAKISGWTAQGTLDPIAKAGVPPVEDFVEEIVHELNEICRQLSSLESGHEFFPGNIDHVQLSTRDLLKDHRDVPKREQFRSGQLIDLALVPLLNKGGGSDVGNVIGIDIPFTDMGVGKAKVPPMRRSRKKDSEKFWLNHPQRTIVAGMLELSTRRS
ncbi:MAG: hypothetical protein AAF191_13720, partial [Verrucomicrobiota bacterium]